MVYANISRRGNVRSELGYSLIPAAEGKLGPGVALYGPTGGCWPVRLAKITTLGFLNSPGQPVCWDFYSVRAEIRKGWAGSLIKVWAHRSE